jgi:hypothetical protein
MQSWQILHLEPSSLWRPDKFATPPGLGADGFHLSATLYYLSHPPNSSNSDSSNKVSDNKAALIYDQIASRLSKFKLGG